MNDRPAATRDDWQTLPMPAARRPIDVAVALTADERSSVERGFVPRQMEDKWFAFVEAGRLYCCRSWSGFTIFEATLLPSAKGGGTLTHVVVNAEPTQFDEDDPATTAAMFKSIIRVHLLTPRGEDDDGLGFTILEG